MPFTLTNGLKVTRIKKRNFLLKHIVVHVRLQEEMISLDESERRLRNDAENLTHRMQAMSDRMDEFEDHEGLKADTGQKRLVSALLECRCLAAEIRKWRYFTVNRFTVI